VLRAASKIARCGEGRSLGGVQRQIRCASAIDNVRNGNFDGESPCGGTSWRRTDPKETARSRCGRDVPGLVTGAGPRAAATAYATPAMQRPVPYVRPLPWGGANKHTAQAPAVRGCPDTASALASTTSYVVTKSGTKFPVTRWRSQPLIVPWLDAPSLTTRAALPAEAAADFARLQCRSVRLLFRGPPVIRCG
jgi:hypothetical protein